MNRLSILQIVDLARARLECGDGERVVEKINTDSRTIRPNELFVALRGQNFDGRKFVEDVVESGAAGAMVDPGWKGEAPPGFAIIRAADTLRAYQQLAANYRRSLGLKVICITGSNGKTSTKDFTAAVLGRKFRVAKTEGNFNNHVGLPRTILEADSDDEIGVWEIGMNHPGEIAPLAKMAAPDAAIITNIGIAHIEFMGTREAIAQEKGALVEHVDLSGTVILSGDDDFGPSIAARSRAKVVFAGLTNGQIHAEEISQSAEGTEFTILEGAHRCRAQMPVPGLHMVQNALLAVAAGRVFGLSLEECAQGLASTPLTKARLQIKAINGVKFIDDSYNANPDSMKAALRTLVELEADGKRVAVLGHMGELGASEKQGHREVGQCAAELRIDHLIALDETMAEAARQAGLEQVDLARSTSEAADLLGQIAAPGDLVLVKGSRLARTEEVIEQFRSSPSTTRP